MSTEFSDPNRKVIREFEDKKVSYISNQIITILNLVILIITENKL